ILMLILQYGACPVVVMAERKSYKKRNELSLQQKILLIKEHESSKKSIRALAEQFNCGKTQACTIINRKRDYMTAFEENADSNRKRICYKRGHEDINEATWKWFQATRALNIPLSGPLLQEKALQFARELKIEDFKASNGWLESFRRRHNISFNIICGESASVPESMTENWNTCLPELIKNYLPEDIWNMDETGLFFRALPDKTLVVKAEDCKRGKHSKEHLTVVICANIEGTFTKPWVIGKAQRPRCFRNLDLTKLPVTWRHNKKAWMTGDLFKEWISEFNRIQKLKNRKALLFLDNVPAHIWNVTLSNTTVKFFPDTTISCCQPMAQGVIQALKVNYRKHLLRSVLHKIEKNKKVEEIVKDITVFDSVVWIKSSVMNVSPHAVTNCYRKAGFSTEELTNEDEIEDNELEELTSETQLSLNMSQPLLASEYVDIDKDLSYAADTGPDFESQILNEIKGLSRNEDDAEDN
uniref:HTH CENPB-type domain-containing protein n=1 Tax=Latimeria chalumnae TaxID=7897 RepID=H3A4H9_LATCH